MFFRACPRWVVKSPRGFLFLFKGSFLPIFLVLYFKLTTASFFSFLFACRMTRGHEEVSTSQAGRRRGSPLGNGYYKQCSCCHVYRGTEVI